VASSAVSIENLLSGTNISSESGGGNTSSDSGSNGTSLGGLSMTKKRTSYVRKQAVKEDMNNG